MTLPILMRVLEKIDSLGIVKRGYDESIGQNYYPAIILDGHISHMGLSFLTYINDKNNRWGGYLVCPYGTSNTQF